MRKIKKIAILTDNRNEPIQIQAFKLACEKANVNVNIFIESETLLAYQPDFVLVTTPEHAKLTPYPTYGLINRPKDDYLELPRYLRNILTYDGYLTSSSQLEQMLHDVMFGTRKLNTSILRFDLYPCLTNCKPPEFNDSFVIFEPNIANSKFKHAIQTLLDKFSNAKLLAFTQDTHQYVDRTIHVHDLEMLQQALHNAGIVVCFYSGDEQQELVFPEMLQIIAASAAAIVHHTTHLERIFGESLYYIPANTSLESLPAIIEIFVNKIKQNPLYAVENVKHAHQIFTQSFALDYLLNDLFKFHQHALINKGYLPKPDVKFETGLPSITYIMRTGGKYRPFLERALDCLVAQNYPDLRVIFVIHAHFNYMDEIIAKYSSLKIKVVESIKSQRSEAIRDGMAAVETELFGLFDDDDELFPNHVRSLVYALRYHNKRDWRGKIGMVYSGSIHADDTFPVEERVEYRDHKLENRFEKRAIEHFKFYSSTLMSRHAWFMPNGWLARSKLIDEELLIDPQLDTCEDLYFELQIAQRAHFAFSMEVTAVHNFHHLGNSTIDDSHKHLPDTQRIALRNLGRVFPPDMQYDTHYSVIGQRSTYDSNQIAYQDRQVNKDSDIDYYRMHPFYPLRTEIQAKNYNDPAELAYAKLRTFSLPTLPIKFFKYGWRFLALSREKKLFYLQKFKSKVSQFGLLSAIYLTFYKLQNNSSFTSSKNALRRRDNAEFNKFNMRDKYYRFRITAKYNGWSKALKSLFNRSLNS